ncbi:MAG: 50S ribosomal protein L4 [Nitrospirae bacterium]|nr:50S ribosomal protein L4 [Nitrospirota bacterium]
MKLEQIQIRQTRNDIMFEIEIKDINNKTKGKSVLSDEIFASKASESVVHSAVVAYLANQRQGTHAVKTRGMVSGGGRKPWKQKKTGRSRHGSNRSPIWRGGGVAFGPHPRDYTIKLPKNMKTVALYKALTMKLNDGELGVVDQIAIDMPSTRRLLMILKNMQLADRSVLIVTSDNDDSVTLSARNIHTVNVKSVSDICAYHVAASDYILFTEKALLRLQNTEVAAA